jgi:regulator of CtrA degradation
MLKLLRDKKGRSSEGAGVETQPTAFFSKTYDEALRLVEDARGYLASLEPIDRRGLGPPERLRLCAETMRMTARLTQIMAWLLVQRAVHEGELTRTDALSQQEMLAGVRVCMEGSEEDWRGLPRRLVALLDKSHRLYVRVARLDELARRQAG